MRGNDENSKKKVEECINCGKYHREKYLKDKNVFNNCEQDGHIVSNCISSKK